MDFFRLRLQQSVRFLKTKLTQIKCMSNPIITREMKIHFNPEFIRAYRSSSSSSTTGLMLNFSTKVYGVN